MHVEEIAVRNASGIDQLTRQKLEFLIAVPRICLRKHKHGGNQHCCRNSENDPIPRPERSFTHRYMSPMKRKRVLEIFHRLQVVKRLDQRAIGAAFDGSL